MDGREDIWWRPVGWGDGCNPSYESPILSAISRIGDKVDKIFIKRLKHVESVINEAAAATAQANKYWGTVAISCNYCYPDGSDGDKCSHPDQENTFCYAEDCPLFNQQLKRGHI